MASIVIGIIIIIFIIMRPALPLTSPLSPVLANTNHLITHTLPKDDEEGGGDDNEDGGDDDDDDATVGLSQMR